MSALDNKELNDGFMYKEMVYRLQCVEKIIKRI